MTGVLYEQCLLPLKSMKGTISKRKEHTVTFFVCFNLLRCLQNRICSFSSKCHLKQRVKVVFYLKKILTGYLVYVL